MGSWVGDTVTVWSVRRFTLTLALSLWELRGVGIEARLAESPPS
jgi:hypothetical protein